MKTYVCECCNHVINLTQGAVPVECPKCQGGDMLPLKIDSAPVSIPDINTGFGIGGYGSDDYSIQTEYQPEYKRPKSLAQGEFCRYCGCPATAFGFFDEPVCPECGG